ncbi:MAG: hypothetical protein D6826_07190 [Alphaproteobacteria bacterium]|nr:MAG: hypothetical protein D6826_07190 [Alphaproteobacteria bacterium]
MFADGAWLPIALGLYFAAALSAVIAVWRGRSVSTAMTLLAIALACHTVAIALRWVRLGHGPYVDLFEVLSSNVWSLHLAVLIAALAFPRIRASLAAILPLLQILVIWLLTVPERDTLAPVTYDTVWLPIHVTLGKIFLGCTVVAVGLSIVILIRRHRPEAFSVLPRCRALDELAYRFVLIAFIFETLMLIAGAIWAQDAWGRYWAWDPLETWAFITWLAVAGYLHQRAVWKPSPVLNAILVVGIFTLAFSTFFGTPFISTAPHKGAI